MLLPWQGGGGGGAGAGAVGRGGSRGAGGLSHTHGIPSVGAAAGAGAGRRRPLPRGPHGARAWRRTCARPSHRCGLRSPRTYPREPCSLICICDCAAAISRTTFPNNIKSASEKLGG